MDRSGIVDRELYDIKAIPLTYILDKDKRIIQKSSK